MQIFTTKSYVYNIIFDMGKTQHFYITKQLQLGEKT